MQLCNNDSNDGAIINLRRESNLASSESVGNKSHFYVFHAYALAQTRIEQQLILRLRGLCNKFDCDNQLHKFRFTEHLYLFCVRMPFASTAHKYSVIDRIL